MKIFLKTIAPFLGLIFMMTGCYDDFTEDAPVSTVCFVQGKPLRTVIADRDMEIFVGVSIGGKRSVDMNDWAAFSIDESLLDGTGLALLPPSYYNLSDPDRFTVRKSNMSVADVGITFTEAFYSDPNAIRPYYALPLKIEDHSLDEMVAGKESTVMAVKYISAYHGTYYLKGSYVEVSSIGGDAVGTPFVYSNKDLSKNMTCDFSTLSTKSVSYRGAPNIGVTVMLTVSDSGTDGVYDVAVADGGGAFPVTGGTGKYYAKEEHPEFVVSYHFESSGKFYRVEETMVLRQDPLKDLRVESW